MSIPDEGRYPPIELSAEQQKFLLLTALCKQLFSLADQKPVLCIFEDLQWIDHTTLEYIDFMLSQIQSRRIFVILTYRPGFEPKWIGEANVTIVNINKLPASLSNSLIANITGNKPLPKEVIEKIVEKTDGIPLFVEELTKTILTSGMLTETEVGYELAGELKNLSIPNTLHDSLMSRLDRLGSAKNVAQIGAAIGRVFNHELIRLLTAYSEQVLQNELTKLLDAGLIFQRGTGPDTDYTFNHALIQDTAYESLLKSRRQTLHGEIANTMVDHFPGRLDIEPEIAAHYFFRAGQTVSAIKYCLRAGIRANKRSASVEAINHLTSAMDGFADLDPTSHDDKLKLDVMVQRVAPTIAVKGYSAPELQNLYPEILKIGSKLGDTPQIFPALYVHWVSVWTTDNLSSALDYAKDFHKLAREQNSTSASITAERITATVMSMDGNPTAACQLFDSVYQTINQGGAHESLIYGQDNLVLSNSYHAIALATVGQIKKALQLCNDGLVRSKQLNHAATSVTAHLIGGGLTGTALRDVTLLETHIGPIASIVDQNPMALWEHSPALLSGYCALFKGNYEESVILLEQVMSAFDELNFCLWKPVNHFHLAEAYLGLEDHQQALESVQQGLVDVGIQNEHWYEPELYRMQGRILEAQSKGKQQVKQCYQKAILVAQSQSAKLFELRAALDLAKSWYRQGRNDNVRDLLTPLTHWFCAETHLEDLEISRTLLSKLADR